MVIKSPSYLGRGKLVWVYETEAKPVSKLQSSLK